MSNRSTPPHLLIPSTLPILPLTTGILFPKLVVTVPINSRQSLELLKSVILEAEEAPLGLDGRRRRPIVGCVPLKHGSGGGDAKDPANADPSNELQVIKVPDDAARDGTLPVSDDAGAHDRRTSPDDLFGWGCAARIVRIERVNDSSYRTTLEGLSRVRIERFTQFVPSIEAKVTVFAEQGLPHTAAPLLNSLRDVSQDLLGALEKLSLPPLILKRIRAFISGVTLSGAGSLADVMVAAADVPISEKLDILATPSPEERVTRVVELLHQQKEVVDVTRKIGEKVSKNLSRRQREFFLRQQLEAIRQELAELEGKEGGSGSSPSSSSSASDFIKRLGGGGAGAGSDEEQDELKELENKIQAAQMPPEALQMTLREYKRLRRTPPLLAEHHVLKSYLETMVDLPWGRGTPSDAMLDPEFVGRARKQLDDDHYGMDKVKRRLLEYLAVMRLRGEVEAAARAEAEKIEQEKRELQEASESSGVLADALQGKEAEVNGLLDSKVGPIETSPAAAPPPPAPAQVPEKDAENVKPKAVNKSPILLLVGPPGVGKTSIAKSLATSMGRKFQRISLGGVRDEAEIRGHRRTYVGSMPGLIAQTLRKVGVNNPVILLDEIDKVSSHSFHGDPSAALLEVLDPEQNFSFGDHYINTPIDLSTVLFIATANTLETISAPLLDRMEVIELSGYTYDEKLAIAKRYLLPKQVEANVMKPEHVQISDDALVHLITAYTREAGVRTLEREIGSVCRAKAVEYAETRNSKEKEYNPIVTVDDLTKILGVEKCKLSICVFYESFADIRSQSRPRSRTSSCDQVLRRAWRTKAVATARSFSSRHRLSVRSDSSC